MKKTSLLMLAAALCAPAYGCAHEESNGRTTTAESTQSSGAQNSGASRNTRASSPGGADEGGERADARARENPGDAQETTAANTAPETRGESDVTTGGAAATSSGIVEESGEASNNPPPTAQDQPAPGNDAEITLAIRQALVADDSLGIRARNATIVTRRGVVTLRGTVTDDAERNAIERHARATTGVARVDNRIAVRP